jgi:DegV family protein with EDD domain
MAVKVVTDSTADLPPELAGELGIAVVPIVVRFGTDIYRDGVDISSDGLMEKLSTVPVHPSTSQPSPDDFIKIYSEFAGESGGIISIHISAKTSGTYDSAVLAGKMLPETVPIEIIDSGLNSAGLALIVIRAAKMSMEGGSLQEIKSEVEQAIRETRMLGVFDTMTYLARGGRVNRAIADIGDFLDIKPLLTFRDGEIIRAGMVRTFSRGIDRLYRFAASKKGIREMAIAHSAIPETAERFRSRLGDIFPAERIMICRLGAALGTHGGPGVLLIAVRYSGEEIS